MNSVQSAGQKNRNWLPNGLSLNITFVYWFYAITACLVTFASGILLLPAIRTYPRFLHEYVWGLGPWQSRLTCLIVGFIGVYLFFNLFAPRWIHLKRLLTHPPSWFGVILGMGLVCVFDLSGSISQDKYKSSISDWLAYIGLPFFLIGLLQCLWRSSNSKPSIESITQASLDSILSSSLSFERWLESDKPSDIDLLDRSYMVERIRALLQGERARSVAIVGPYGSGKSTIVNLLMADKSVNEAGDKPHLIFCHHNCWGFKNSSLAIDSILHGAVSELGKQVDTFPLKSLPESYRNTFSAGGEWLDSLSKLIFGNPNHSVQFERLSDLLRSIDSHLAITIEDLDRVDSSEFQTPEFLGFLRELSSKEYPELALILTGAQDSVNRIDFSRICDHVEHVDLLSAQAISRLSTALRNLCFDKSKFSFIDLSKNVDHEWNWELSPFLMDGSAEAKLTLPEALKRLLKVPRSLRHALSLTYISWKNLAGEVNWYHLLIINAVRFSAPEVFEFIWRNREYVIREPESIANAPERKLKNGAVKNDWEVECQKQLWDTAVSKTVLSVLFPYFPTWIGEDFKSDEYFQGVHLERYWSRVIRGHIASPEILDQDVIRDYEEWTKNRREDAPWIKNIADSVPYFDVWYGAIRPYLNFDSQRRLLAFEQIIARLGEIHGPSAVEHDAPLIILARDMLRHSGFTNDDPVPWVLERISQCAPIGLRMLHRIGVIFVDNSDDPRLLVTEDIPEVTNKIYSAFRETAISIERFERLLHLIPQIFGLREQSIIRSFVNWLESVIVGPLDWSWLGPVLLKSLQRSVPLVPIEVSCLIASGEKDLQGSWPCEADPLRIEKFFGVGSMPSVISELEKAAKFEIDDYRPRIEQLISFTKREYRLDDARDNASKSLS